MLRRKGFAGTTANQRETANLETPTNEAETSLQLEGIMHHPSSVAAPGLGRLCGGKESLKHRQMAWQKGSG